MKKAWFILLLGICVSNVQAQTKTQWLEQVRREPQLRAQMKSLVERALLQGFGQLPPDLPQLDPSLTQPQALFITLKLGDETRGCMGTLKPTQGSLAEEIRVNLEKALFQDPRHRPVLAAEIQEMEIYLSAVGTPQAVSQVGELNPMRDGLLIQSGSKGAVVLPGEAKTARYLLAFAKAKAGISSEENYQLFRVPTLTVSVGKFSLPSKKIRASS